MMSITGESTSAPSSYADHLALTYSLTPLSGGCGNSCPSDKGTPVCNSGTCSYSSCKNPFTLVNGQCANINTQTDPNNCGSVGKVCKLSDYSNANSVQCSASTCVATCQNGFDCEFPPRPRRQKLGY